MMLRGSTSWLAHAIIALLSAWFVLPAQTKANDWNMQALERLKKPPLGLPSVPLPPDNKPTAKKISLGRKLFFDRRLSSNNTMSCAMCHIPEQGFTSNELATAIGVEGRSGRRNTPTIFNVAYMQTLFHDARDTSLETQIFGPMLAYNEMANPSIGWLLHKIKRLENYVELFDAAFGTGPDVRTLGWALASYQRTILSANTPFDRWFYGKQKDALSPLAVRGYDLFVGKARCSICHTVEDNHALFTDQQLHNTGVGAARDEVAYADQPLAIEISPGLSVNLSRKRVNSVGHPPLKDFGRLEVTDNPDDLYMYKTPGLRNVALTAPYMHDGSLRTLEDVVRYYNRGGYPNPGLDPLLSPLNLNNKEIKALIAFLNSLTGDNIDQLIADARSETIGN